MYFPSGENSGPSFRLPDRVRRVSWPPAAGFLSLTDVIAALVVIRIALQFLVQAVGVIVLRVRRPELPRPFRMWLYPLPAVVASAGFVFILLNRHNAARELRYATVVLLVGLAIYLTRAWRRRDWPFAPTAPRSREQAA